MTRQPWRRALLGRLVSLAQRGTPRLETLYGRLPESAGLSPGMSQPEHEARVLRYLTDLSARVAALPQVPRVSLLVTDAGDADQLGSIALQVLSEWELVAVVPEHHTAGPALTELERRLPGQVVRVPADTSAEGDRLQLALAAATGDYVAALRSGDRLYPWALAEVARAFDLERRLAGSWPDVAYSDERRVDAAGDAVGDPVFKPAWSPLLLRSGDYLGALTLYRREVAGAAGGFRDTRDPAHDLALRVTGDHPPHHIPHVLCQRRTGSEVGAHWSPTLPEPPPEVTVVIPTRDQGGLLRRCLATLSTRTDYPAFRVVLVDNGTTEPVAADVLRRASEDGRVTVLQRPGPFNFAQLCNAGAALAADDGVVVLLNNDTEVVAEEWLRALVAAAMLPGVGAVGAQLRYPDGRIQHAGIAGFGDAGTGHVFLNRDPGLETPLGLVQSTREVLAVTGACLALRAAVYREAGGLDESVVPNDSGDVDLCLRLRELGYVSVYAPQAVLLHHESPTRGRSFVDFERFYLRRRWPQLVLNDPYLNPHLARTTKMVPDPRFPVPDLPGAVFARWLAAGVIPSRPGAG